MTVAFSAGVDSSFLLTVAHWLLGDACVAVTARSALFPQAELRRAALFCEQQGVRHVLMPFDEMQVDQIGENLPDRCYWCKLSFMGKLKQIAQLIGCPCVVEGSNVDDDSDYRPGSRAVRELGIASPLKDAGMTKSDIRKLSCELGLSTWDKPSFACMASRVPYGESITLEKLSKIEKAEGVLAENGFQQFRVRAHEVSGGKELLARIEVPIEDMPRFADSALAERVNGSLLEAGFAYVALDLGGYETGRLNRAIS